MEVYFYHIIEAKPEDLITSLLKKSISRGWRCFLRFPNKELALDMYTKIWQIDPYNLCGLATEDFAAQQPILLSTDNNILNNADICFLIAGAEYLDIENISRFQRIVIIFDGMDSKQVEDTRNHWIYFKQCNYRLEYYKQELMGRWKLHQKSEP